MCGSVAPFSLTFPSESPPGTAETAPHERICTGTERRIEEPGLHERVNQNGPPPGDSGIWDEAFNVRGRDTLPLIFGLCLICDIHPYKVGVGMYRGTRKVPRPALRPDRVSL